MSKDQEIRELFKHHGLPLDRDDVWAVHGQPVVRHRALERLGAVIGIVWDKPQIVRAERDEAVLLIAGTIGREIVKLEWSMGEACLGVNYKAPGGQAYVYAMAEKRGKDRVILKLAGLQGVYSEEEADDFKSRDPEPDKERETPMQDGPADRSKYIEGCYRFIDRETKVANLKAWWERERLTIHKLDESVAKNIYDEFLAKGYRLAAASTVENAA